MTDNSKTYERGAIGSSFFTSCAVLHKMVLKEAIFQLLNRRSFHA